MAFYVLDDNNNKVEAYDKEGVLAVLEQAIEAGSLAEITADSGFITKLKCCVGGDTHKIGFCTQAKYNELKANNQLIDGAYYFITDDTTAQDIDAALDALTERVTTLENNTASMQTQINTIKNSLQIISLDSETDIIYDSSQTTQPMVDLSSQITRSVNDIIGIGGVLAVTSDKGSFELFFTAFYNEYDNAYAKECLAVKFGSSSSSGVTSNFIDMFMFSLGITSGASSKKLRLSSILGNRILHTQAGSQSMNMSSHTISKVGVDTLRIYYK